MREIKITSNKRNEMIDVTDKVQKIVEEEKLQNGIVIIYVPHTTAGVTINEGADYNVQRDIIETLKKLVPENNSYHHMEGNSDAHIKASLLGSSVSVIVENNSLILGTWQRIFFYEADGPRNRILYLKFLKK
ncbi:MAG: YjbQ family protein [Thermoplasmata archaeon]|nr:MAG: YjbQ family protein [Thermoplasmata archaeon]